MYVDATWWLIAAVLTVLLTIIAWHRYGVAAWIASRLDDSEYLDVSEEEFEDFITLAREQLAQTDVDLHFDQPLTVIFTDRFGGGVAQVIRWPSRRYYLIRESWYRNYME